MSEQRLYKTVAHKILDLIDSGEFKPGSRLPGERELAERFSVSRLVVREAEISLETVGKVEVKTGSGVYVLKPDENLTAYVPDIGPFELTEARALFEGEAAALAAPIISKTNLAELEAIVQRMNLDMSDEVDREFHLKIADATGNAAVIHIIKTLWDMRAESKAKYEIYESVCAEDTSQIISEHNDILDALKAGDASKARTAMRQHFTRLIEAMLVVTEQEELQAARQKISDSRARFSISSQIS